MKGNLCETKTREHNKFTYILTDHNRFHSKMVQKAIHCQQKTTSPLEYEI